MATEGDRLNLLRARDTTFTGIDFVHVVDRCDQTHLDIFFLTDIRHLTTPFSGATALKPEDIVIHPALDPTLPNIEVAAIVEVSSGGPVTQAQFDQNLKRSFISIIVKQPGDFTRYRLRIDDPAVPVPLDFSRIDSFFNDVEFSFKVACEDRDDCEPPPPDCPPEEHVDFPVDYLARDFVSFRNALLDFAAQRYPQWTLPTDADVGVMLAEVFAALGDEFSYIQDRHAREAFLETADQRRSLRKKARLLDFEIHDGRSGTTLLELTVRPGTTDADLAAHPPKAGDTVWAPSEGGTPVPFEVGLGLHDLTPDNQPTAYPVRPEWNEDALQPYFFDETRCLEIGATEILVLGAISHASDIAGLERPRSMLLRTEPQDPSVPARRHFVRLTDEHAFEQFVDPLAPLNNPTITRIRWDARDALPFQIDQDELTLSLNIVPATAGETFSAKFVTGPVTEEDELLPLATEREGAQPMPTREVPFPERPTIFLFGLPEAETQGLGFLGEALRATVPEVRVKEVTEGPAGEIPGNAWAFERTLIGAEPDDEVFTLEDGTWRAIRTFRTFGQPFTHQDYASGHGFSLRFGDGQFGREPPRGTHFRVTFRTGPGAKSNLPENAITALSLPEKPQKLPGYVIAVTNPVAITTGVDPETAAEIKLNTPEAYQSEIFFAVRPGDYAEQAAKLPFVQRAMGTPRWTGSWLSTFVSADPFGAFRLADEQRRDLENWMDCVRQAGRQVIVQDPKTLAIDLEIHLCIEPFAHPGQVVAQVQEVLLGSGQGRHRKGFFHPDNFTFGTPLRRSALEAEIRNVPGVRSVRNIFYRLRGVRRFQQLLTLTVPVSPDQVLRLDNDPLRPGNGTLNIFTEGGA